jgi:hypothetical protein
VSNLALPEEVIQSALLTVPQGMAVADYIDEMTKVALSVPQANTPVIHRFAPGLYIREVSAPAGTFAIGHYQKTEHLNIFLKGRVTILKDDGTTEELAAPMMFVSKPGRKCGYVTEDMVWQNIYPTTETDVEKLEEMFLDKCEYWKDLSKARLEATRPTKLLDRNDYFKVLIEYGLTEEQVQAEVQNTEDQIPFEQGGYQVQIGDSPIHGKGIFATGNFAPGDTIAMGRIGSKRTPVGRFTNHSMTPNAGPILLDNGDIAVIALRTIYGCQGGALGEEITIDYRAALHLRGARRVR